MKNKLITALLAVLILGGSLTWAQVQQPASAPTTSSPAAGIVPGTIKIGYTNMEFILQNVPEYKDITNQVTIQRTQLENNFKLLSKEFEDKLRAYETGSAQMSEVIKADKEKELQGLQQRIQEFQTSSSQQLQVKYQQLVNPVLQKIQTNIDAVAKENSYNYVFNLDAGSGTIPILLYAPEESNITDLVFKKMGVTPPTKQPASSTATKPTTPLPTTPKKN